MPGHYDALLLDRVDLRTGERESFIEHGPARSLKKKTRNSTGSAKKAAYPPPYRCPSTVRGRHGHRTVIRTPGAAPRLKMAAAAAEADAKLMAEERPEGNMKVLVDVGGAGLSRRRMEIPVGPGTQSLKWLGLVAAQRHALLAKHTKTGRRSKQGAQPDEGQGFFYLRT